MSFGSDDAVMLQQSTCNTMQLTTCLILQLPAAFSELNPQQTAVAVNDALA